MKKSIIFILLIFTLSLNAQGDLERKLFELSDVIFQRIDTPEGYNSAYELRIKQPIDHKDISKGHFYQRVFLSHRGYGRPTVMATEGYQRPRNRRYELTDYVEGNQLDIEHRYFGESLPEGVDYQYLTLEQATADLHHINTIFKQIYKGKWLSTGISKGGQTTIFYRYLYPDDVDVSVPYVAPLNLALEDERIYDWLDKAGTKKCRQAIEDIQIRLLKESDKAISMMKWYAKGAKLEFNYLSLAQAYEYGVLEYPFSFFQWGSDCATIPDANGDFDTVLEHFLEVSGISFFSDKDMANYASHYYQAGMQMGYYSYETEPFTDLLKALPTKPHPSAIFMPNKDAIEFDNKLPLATSKWLKTEGNNFIYIYGADDTWSATGVPPSKKTNSLWVIMDGKHHGNARIKNMTKENKDAVEMKLEKWLEVEVEIK